MTRRMASAQKAGVRMVWSGNLTTIKLSLITSTFQGSVWPSRLLWRTGHRHLHQWWTGALHCTAVSALHCTAVSALFFTVECTALHWSKCTAVQWTDHYTVGKISESTALQCTAINWSVHCTVLLWRTAVQFQCSTVRLGKNLFVINSKILGTQIWRNKRVNDDKFEIATKQRKSNI